MTYTISGEKINSALMRMPRKQRLLTKELEKKLPPLGSTDDNPDKIAIVKFFTPAPSWTWYAVEYCPEEKLFFGLVEGLEREWGYFSLAELESLNAAVERDIHFQPTKISL
jgi:hypothetical protein